MFIFKVLWFLFNFVFKGLMFSWPISLSLLAILMSELEHAPRKWDHKYWIALAPLGISASMFAWATAAIFFPFLRCLTFGFNIGQWVLAAEIFAACYAWKQLDGHRCFFLSLLLVELWIGYWATMVAGFILSQLCR